MLSLTEKIDLNSFYFTFLTKKNNQKAFKDKNLEKIYKISENQSTNSTVFLCMIALSFEVFLTHLVSWPP